MDNNLKTKLNYITKSLKNNIIKEKLGIDFYEWSQFGQLTLFTEICSVDVISNEIADAWILEIDNIKKLFNIN